MEVSQKRFLLPGLLLFYLILPWIYVGGKQWVLIDIPRMELTLFGSVFHTSESVFLVLIFLSFILAIAFVTSIWGRVWCGWACPQTVFIDFIYRKVERVIEGNARKRKKLNASKMSFEKLWKKGLKWLLFLIISLHIVHSFLGVFCWHEGSSRYQSPFSIGKLEFVCHHACPDRYCAFRFWLV